MNLLLVNLNTVVAVLCLLMALHLFFQKTLGQLAIRLLAACFLVLGLHALLLGFNFIRAEHSRNIPRLEKKLK